MGKVSRLNFIGFAGIILAVLAVVFLEQSRHDPLELPEGPDRKTLLSETYPYEDTFPPTDIPYDDLCSPDAKVRLAAAGIRREYMLNLIQSNPERALEEALSLSEWNQLPKDVQDLVEIRFSSLADVEVIISCFGHNSETEITTRIPGHETFDTFLFGRRKAMGTKFNLPVDGIRVGNVATFSEDIFQRLSQADEAIALEHYPVAVPDPGGDSIAGLAAGRIFYFNSQMALDEANHRLAMLESLPGPYSGYQVLLEREETVLNEDGSINFGELESIAMSASTAWTGTPRDMYIIMVDFSDNNGQPADPIVLEDSLNNAISQQIWQMSYEKSHIVGTVNPTTYRLPQTAAYYTSSTNDLHDDAVDAAGADLSSYETVCVLFPNISGFSWAGLASVGGSRMWLNGSSGVDLILHELGHNYGARHASTWLPGNSNPVDPSGGFYEYGDDMDIMGSGDSPEGHFNAWHKKRVGWFDSENWQSVTTSGSYRIYRSDHQQTSGLLRGLEIQKGSGDTYWISHRHNYPEFESYSRGAYLIWKQSGDNRSYLLDMSPQSSGGEGDGGLALGQTYSDTTAAVHITPTARGGQTPDEWMDIMVNLGSFAGNNSPTGSLSGPTSASARTSYLFSVTASDPDGDELAYYWDIGDGLAKPNSPALPVAWSSGGVFTVSCILSDMKGGTTQVSQVVTVSDPLDNWTQQSSGTTYDLNDVAVGGGRIVAVGDIGRTVYSDDGINWILHTDLSVWEGNVFLEGISYDGAQFIATGMDYNSGWEQVLFTSADGTYWTKQYDSNSGSGSNTRLSDVAYGNGVYIAVGDDGTIVRSTDSTTWSSVSSGTTEDLDSVAYGDGVFVIASSGGSGGPAIVITSSDGLTWTDHSAGVDLNSWKGFYNIEFCEDRFVASGWYARIMTSTDQGQTFTTLMTGDRADIAGFAYGNGVYFGAGINKDNGNADINYVSLDGAHWTELPTSSQLNRNAAAFFNGAFFTVGVDGSIWKSDATSSISSGYGTWQLVNSEALGFNRDPLDDADWDGFFNIDEYALGSLATNSGSMPAAGTSSHDGTYLQVTYQRDGIKSDIDYTGEWSTDLSSSWSSTDTTTTEDTATHITIQSNHTLSSEPKQFLRLNMELK